MNQDNAKHVFVISHKIVQLITLYDELIELIEYCATKEYKLPDAAWQLYELSQLDVSELSFRNKNREQKLPNKGGN